jgi:hypothetical protein
MILSQLATDIPQIVPAGSVAADLLLQLIPHFGVLGVLVWYMHYDVKHARPEKDKQHADVIKALNEEHSKYNQQRDAEHRAAIKEMTAKFDEHLREERLMRQQDIRALTAAIHELVKGK